MSVRAYLFKAMRNLLLIVFFGATICHAQSDYCSNFDSSFPKIKITATGQWSIGLPSKTNFNNSLHGTKSLMTDTLNPYSASDTSVVEITFYPNGGIAELNLLYIEMVHRFETDFATDFGYIDFSIDSGHTWQKFIPDSNYLWSRLEHYYLDKDTIVYENIPYSGSSEGWIHSRVGVDVFNHMSFDSVLLRIHFFSDSIDNGKEGWQIDSMCIYEVHYGSVSKTNQSDNIIQVYPNPTDETLSIRVLEPTSDNYEMIMFTAKGSEIQRSLISGHSATSIDVSLFTPGLYMYFVRNEESIVGSGKFIKE